MSIFCRNCSLYVILTNIVHVLVRLLNPCPADLEFIPYAGGWDPDQTAHYEGSGQDHSYLLFKPYDFMQKHQTLIVRISFDITEIIFHYSAGRGLR